MAKIKVYSLLSLDGDTIHSLLPGCDVAPPVGRGDITSDIRSGYQLIVVIDGRFHQSAAVSCDEIMDALRCGVVVVGAASMGALRAAELWQYGMIGVGKIFEHIRDATIFRDDFVGQTFGEISAGVVRPLSIPFVDMHFALQRMLEQRVVTEPLAAAVTAIAGELHYTERTPDILAECLADDGFGESEIRDLLRALTQHSQKKVDAIEAVEYAAEHLAAIKRMNARLDDCIKSG